VAIYTATRIDFDLAAAVRLALLQLAACAFFILPATLFAPPALAARSGARLFWPEPRPVRLLAGLVVGAALFFFGLPMLAVLWEGLAIGGLLTRLSFWTAAGTSLAVGTASALLALLLG